MNAPSVTSRPSNPICSRKVVITTSIAENGLAALGPVLSATNISFPVAAQGWMGMTKNFLLAIHRHVLLGCTTGNHKANDAQRTRPSRSGCNPRVPQAGSLGSLTNEL